MGRISSVTLTNAIQKIGMMNSFEKALLIDEIHRVQPFMLASCLVVKRLGASIEKIELLFDILLICYQSMQESGLEWPLITEKHQGRFLLEFAATLSLGKGLTASLARDSFDQYARAHPEYELLSFVNLDTSKWISQEKFVKSDRYILMAAFNLVNCIAYVKMPVNDRS
jgi:hypothetical protein